MRLDEVQTFVNKPENRAFEVCLQRVNMTSHSDVQVQANVYLNLLTTTNMWLVWDIYWTTALKFHCWSRLLFQLLLYILIAACRIGHFCKTVGDWSRVYPTYHEYASGAISSFFIGTLQGYAPALHYIENQSAIPLKMLNITNTPTC